MHHGTECKGGDGLGPEKDDGSEWLHDRVPSRSIRRILRFSLELTLFVTSVVARVDVVSLFSDYKFFSQLPSFN